MHITPRMPAAGFARALAVALTLIAVACCWLAADARSEFHLRQGSFTVETSSTQAGAATDITTKFAVGDLEVDGSVAMDGKLQDAVVELPPGLVGDATAAPRCRTTELITLTQCPPAARVGRITLGIVIGAPLHLSSWLYNMEPTRGATAEFIGNLFIGMVPMEVHVRDYGDFGLTTELRNAFETFPVTDAAVTFWGIPADHNESGSPRRAFIRNASVCGPQKDAILDVTSWKYPGLHVGATAPMPELTGCDRLPPVRPQVAVRPTDLTAGAPTGYDITAEIPRNDDNPTAPATPPVRRISIQLPEGTAISPAAADGLVACSDEQLHAREQLPVACPDASKLGSVSVETPYLLEPLEGAVYAGAPHLGEQFRLFLAIEGSGVHVRLKGAAVADPSSGRLRATFDDLPPIPFTRLHVRFKGGPRAVLRNPTVCGTATSTSTVSPFGGAPDASYSDSFEVVGCGAQRFAPALTAGTLNPIAGDFSPFVLHVTREDRDQLLKGIDLTLPPGQLAKLRGAVYCPGAVLAGISGEEGAAATEAVNPSCPAASRIGQLSVGAGAGSSPLYVDTGRVYLAGPYKGAPLSLAFVTPALAGPFDLGNVVVRSALRLDRVTAQVKAVTDPLPTILHGVPLDLKDVRVSLDRPGFTVNPTSCKKMRVAGHVTSTTGAAASVSNPYQLSDCASLGFKPKLSLRLLGSTHRRAHPRLRAVLKARDGDANIAKAVVTLPKAEFLDNAHIRTVCTRVQYAADNCPKGAVYGYAKAWSPLLDQPLEGPVYLRSSSHPLPDLVASLDGQIHIDLDGRIDSVHSRMRATFASVPDTPVSKFVLQMQGGKKGLLVNNTELCATQPRASVVFAGHNGKRSSSSPRVKTDCGKQ
jgi:hypothetical protein